MEQGDGKGDDVRGVPAMGAEPGAEAGEAVGDAGGSAAPGGAAPEQHEPVACPNEGCGAPAGSSWPWASDQGAAIGLFGKCCGCLHGAGELTEEKGNQILAEAARRGVPADQTMATENVTVEQAIAITLAIVQELQGEVRALRREVAAARLGVGAVIRMNTGGSAALPEPIVKALGIDVAEAEAEATRRTLTEGVAGVDVSRLRRH